jgi:ABC-2 type transport system ATP-binding protein
MPNPASVTSAATATEASAALSIRKLAKTYPADRKGGMAKEALKGIDLEIPRGSFFGLLGPNGAGKSTLINILSGLTIKTAGEASICGYDLEKHMRMARLSIGVVPQELVLDTFFTVREALEIYAGYFGVPTAERRTDAIIKAMGLEDKADINSRRLSGGMRRRLLIGKALVHNPAVLILDEPTAGVDVELREQLWDYVRELNAQGTTILLTTHYLEEAEELCDQIAVINHGKIVANDSKQNLLARVDSKQLIVRMEKPLTEVPEALRDCCDSLQDGQLLVNYRPSEVQFEHLLQRIREATGQPIHDLSTHEADLEDIFRQLVAE